MKKVAHGSGFRKVAECREVRRSCIQVMGTRMMFDNILSTELWTMFCWEKEVFQVYFRCMYTLMLYTS